MKLGGVTTKLRGLLDSEVRYITRPLQETYERLKSADEGKDKVQLMLDTTVTLASKLTARASRIGAAAALGMAIAIGLIGSTVPYNILTPIAITASGALSFMASDVISEKLSHQAPELKRKLSRALRRISDTFVKLFKTMPKFIYPSVHHATDEQIKLVYDTLDKLPIHYVTATNTINFDPNLAKGLGAAGLNQQLIMDRPVTLDVSQMAISKEWAQYVITHELGHANDFLSAQHLNGFISSMKPFNKPPYVTDYASTNQFEDLAESYAHYHLLPEKLKAIAPEKYEALAKVEAVKSIDPLNFIASQEPLREGGKRIGELLSKLPYPVRFFMVGLSTALPMYSLSRAASDFASAKERGDEGKILDSKAMATTALASLVSPPSVTLTTLVEGLTLRKLVDKGKLSVKRANQILNATLAAVLGPIGGALIGTVDGLSSDVKVAKTQEVTSRDWLKFLGSAAVSVIAGVALAGAITGAIAPLLGALVAEKVGFTAGAVTELVGGRLIATGISYGISRGLGKISRALLMRGGKEDVREDIKGNQDGLRGVPKQLSKAPEGATVRRG